MQLSVETRLQLKKPVSFKEIQHLAQAKGSWCCTVASPQCPSMCLPRAITGRSFQVKFPFSSFLRTRLVSKLLLGSRRSFPYFSCGILNPGANGFYGVLGGQLRVQRMTEELLCTQTLRNPPHPCKTGNCKEGFLRAAWVWIFALKGVSIFEVFFPPCCGDKRDVNRCDPLSSLLSADFPTVKSM